MSAPFDSNTAIVDDHELGSHSRNSPTSKMSIYFLTSTSPPAAQELAAMPGEVNYVVDERIHSTAYSRQGMTLVTTASGGDFNSASETTTLDIRSAFDASAPHTTPWTRTPLEVYNTYRTSHPHPLTPLEDSDEEMGDSKDGTYGGSQSTVSGPPSSFDSPSPTIPRQPLPAPTLHNNSPTEVNGTAGPMRRTPTIRHQNSGGFRRGYHRISLSAPVQRTGLPASRNTAATRERRAKEAEIAEQLKTDVEDRTRIVAELKDEIQHLSMALIRQGKRSREESSHTEQVRRERRRLIGPAEESKQYHEIEGSVRLAQSYRHH